MDKQKNEDISFEKQTQRFSGEDVKTTLRDIKSVSQFRDGNVHLCQFRRKWLNHVVSDLIYSTTSNCFSVGICST